MNTHRIHGMTMGMPQCWGIFGSGDKIQTDLTQQTGASEEALLITGAGSTAAKDDAVVLGGSFNTNKITGTDASGGGLINTGVNLGSGTNSGSITINGAAGAEAIAKQFTETLNSINDTASADKLQAQELVADALGKLTELSESKQTEGVSSLGRLALWGLGLILAGLLIWKWNK